MKTTMNKKSLLAGVWMTVMLAVIGTGASYGQSENKSRSIPVPGLATSLTVDLGGGVTMQLVLIRPGSFQMGSAKGSDEKPTHKVTITKPFYLGKYVITQEQWQQVMGNNPSRFKNAQHPVEQVSWDDCQNFIAKLNEKLPGQTFRLPTEAEWEYACRAGTTTDYSFGDNEAALGEYAWYTGNSGATTHPVGEKKPNPWGLYDMHGGVWEWCADWYAGSYTAGDQTDPVGPSSGAGRVLRGGAWYLDTAYCRAAFRGDFAPSSRYDIFGLRVVAVTNP